MKRVALFALCVGVFSLTSYGGLRSPDSEVSFRTALALADKGTFAVDHDLEAWPGFGFSRGTDGSLYSIFGPLEPVLLVPFVQTARVVGRGGWYTSPPTSFHVQATSLHAYAEGDPQEDVEDHALRSLCAIFNVAVTALMVAIFFDILLCLTGSTATSLFGSYLLAFATPLWQYSGTFFSEPLAILFVVLALRGIIFLEADSRPVSRPSWRLFGAGLCLGLAICAHLTAVLVIPFFAAYIWLRLRPPEKGAGDPLRGVAIFLVGVAVLVVLLGYYNHARFGNPFETGRLADPQQAAAVTYGQWVLPWEGLRGLLISSGKGLLFYAPITLLSVLGWRTLHRRHRHLSYALAAAIVFRVIFIASRSDWHGGFALGPRYLIMVLPLLVIPIAVWLHELLERAEWTKVALVLGAAVLASAQQLYFVLGEVFLFLFRLLWFLQSGSLGRPISFWDDWEFTPLHGLLEFERGPCLLRSIGVSNFTLFFVGVLLLCLLFGLTWIQLRREHGVDGGAGS